MEIVIGVYASEKPIGQALESGNLYQASVDFSPSAGKDFEVQPQYCGQAIEDSLVALPRMLEARYDFSQVESSRGRSKRSNSGKPIRKRRVGMSPNPSVVFFKDGARIGIFGSC